MSTSTAELTLIVKAQNLAETELAKVRTSLGKITVTAGQVARDVAAAFKGVGQRIGRQLGNIATDILSGGSLTNNFIYLGATMAGALVEGLSAHLIPMILEKVAASATFAPIIAAFAAGGVTAATVFDAAVALTMAALPFVILAAAVAALVFLATNPEARQKAREVALMIMSAIGDGLRTLGKVLHDRFVAGFDMAVLGVREGLTKMLNDVHDYVNRIVDEILAIPKAVAKALGALEILKARTPAMDAAHAAGAPAPGHASGGWVGLHGPELSWLGEKGPEYVVPNHQLDRMAPQPVGVTIQGVSERDILDMVDRGLYFRLRRAAPAAGRA